MGNRYKEAGVDIEAGDEFINNIKDFAKSTYRKEVLSGIGGFAAHVALNLKDIEEPILVPATDGVGTKLKIAQAMDTFDTLGIDLVAMCVNDVICSGARPLFFLDYLAVDKLLPREHSEIVKGIAEGCRQAECSLVGGETAELSGLYQKGDFDLAGFSVGIVDKKKIIDGSKITAGNHIIGIASSGVHSNGFSLVRKIIEDHKLKLNRPFEGSQTTLGETLLKPTTIYVQLIHALLKGFSILGIAHITGGGLVGNVPRILPKGLKARIDKNSWKRPPIFDFLVTSAGVEEEEMQRVFNLGIGMVLVVPQNESNTICTKIRVLGEEAFLIGEIVPQKTGTAACTVE